MHLQIITKSLSASGSPDVPGTGSGGKAAESGDAGNGSAETCPRFPAAQEAALGQAALPVFGKDGSGVSGVSTGVRSARAF